MARERKLESKVRVGGDEREKDEEPVYSERRGKQEKERERESVAAVQMDIKGFRLVCTF